MGDPSIDGSRKLIVKSSERIEAVTVLNLGDRRPFLGHRGEALARKLGLSMRSSAERARQEFTIRDLVSGM